MGDAEVHLTRWFTAILLALSLRGETVAQTPPLATQLLDALVALDTDRDTPRPPADTAKALRARIIALADELRPSLDGITDGARVVRALNAFVFDRLEIKVSHDLRDPDNLFLSSVLARRQGYCVGIAALYLALAERLGHPIHAVATPSHVFLRYDDGVTRINIETFEHGENIPDERYIREQKIPNAPIEKGVFMRNLTTGEFLAQLRNNLGVIYSQDKNYDRATAEYEAALDLYPRFPAAFYNLGNDRLQQGDARAALRLFSKSLRLYPSDVWALNNRGLAWMKLGKKQKARRDFEAALRFDASFEAARKNLSALGR